MGITAGPTFTTDSGLVIGYLYLSIHSLRCVVTQDGDLQFIFLIKGYKSREDKKLGRSDISLPQNLCSFDTFIQVSDVSNLFDIAYRMVKSRWAVVGYDVNDIFEATQAGYVEPTPAPVEPTPAEPTPAEPTPAEPTPALVVVEPVAEITE